MVRKDHEQSVNVTRIYDCGRSMVDFGDRPDFCAALVAVFRGPEFTRSLNLTPEQAAKVRELNAELTKLAETQRESFRSRRASINADPAGKARSIEAVRNMRDFRTSSEIRLTAMLTPDQRTQMQQLFGSSVSTIKRPRRDWQWSSFVRS